MYYEKIKYEAEEREKEERKGKRKKGSKVQAALDDLNRKSALGDNQNG